MVKATETGEGAFPAAAAAAKCDALQFVGGGMRRTIIAGDAEQQQQQQGQQQGQSVAREQRLHERPRGRTTSSVRAARRVQWLHSTCGKRALRLLFIKAAAMEWEGGGGGRGFAVGGRRRLRPWCTYCNCYNL